MEKAQFQARISPAEVSAIGADTVEFLFSANSGEPARSIAKVASGGELSRVMLAIKVASAGRAGVPTMVFDEVDT
ncbi:DNA repair protein RecN, partial [Acinetobacter baumannii]